jgi:hypothetical protein
MQKNKSLNQKVIDWLKDQGYPLEMKMSLILQENGFKVIQSEYYSDPENKDPREIDIFASKQKIIKDVLFRISYVIECKHSKDKPWLLFTSNETKLADQARVAQRAANSLGRFYLNEIALNENAQSLDLFKLPNRPAYGITQAFTSGKDVCYAAVTSVSKATSANVEELDSMTKTNLRKFTLFRRKICSIFMPIVIVDGNLLEVFLDENAKILVNEIENGTLLWRNPLVGMPHTIINIISANDFERYINLADNSISKFFELAENELKASLSNAKEREQRSQFYS